MPELDLEACHQGVLGGSRAWLARAITLVESRKPEHRDAAQQLLVRLLPYSGSAMRVGLSGVPGAGKSTFIDAIGSLLTRNGHRVAVLAVDPSSTRSGGSILGDKTRMARLATDKNAFVRPSPTAGTLGGVARATRESMVLLEAAGYDVVIVETVGVGQSETAVAGMVDTFALLTLARSGDQLQGIKKGVLEIADLIAVNKADGEHAREAEKAARELSGALRLLRPPEGEAEQTWQTPVLTCSAQQEIGIDAVWNKVLAHREWLAEHGRLEVRRGQQLRDWTWTMVHDRLLTELHTDPGVLDLAPRLEEQVISGELTPALAAERLLATFRR